LTQNGNGKKDRLDRIEELLNMAAAQTAENAKQIAKNSKQIEVDRREWKQELRESRAAHDREMKEIRVELKNLIRRIAS
jgi:hypothetical protein